MADLEKLADELSTLTLLEAAQLKDILEERWGVTAAAPMAVMAGGPMMAGGDAAEAAEEMTEFDVILTDIGPKKIQVIKAVRSLTTLGLGERVELADSLDLHRPAFGLKLGLGVLGGVLANRLQDGARRALDQLLGLP